jgi:hypothetical protein
MHFLRDMLDLDITPSLLQILRNKAAVTVIGFLLTAQ